MSIFIFVWVAIYDLSARRVRRRWRRWRHPDGPPWGRLSCVNVIMALHDCSFDEALRRDKLLAEGRKRLWLEGY